MKIKTVLFLITLIVGIHEVNSQEYLRMIDEGTYPVQEIINSAETYFHERGTGKGSGYKQFKRWEYMALRLMNEDGYLRTGKEKYDAYIANRDKVGKISQNRQSLPDNWQEIGPTTWGIPTNLSPGVGRVTGISIDESNHDHILVGANTGGVWRTVDGGLSWTPLTDFFVNLEVYSVTIDPSNSDIYYFGSTDGLIFKSTDAGINWDLLADLGNSKVNKIKIHPANSDLIFASIETVGFYRTLDGGLIWEEIPTTNRAYDIEFKPGDPSVVYISGTNFYRSIDGGVSFNVVTGFGFMSHKMIGVSADDPEVVYVLEAWFGGDFRALYKSTDSGASFVELDQGSLDYLGSSYLGHQEGSQAPRDMDITVNPINADEVHIGGINTWRSLDGGSSFICTGYRDRAFAISQDIGYCHADIDIMEFAGDVLFLGTDGGIFKAEETDLLNSDYYTDITTGMGIQQFYKIGVAQLPNELITGGSQDNGSTLYNSTVSDWRKWLGADGMEGFIDKDNPNIIYGTTQYGRLYRSEDGGNSYVNITEPGPGEGNWVTPFEQDPQQPNTIYVGYDAVYKSNDKGGTWNQISQNFGSNLRHLKVAPTNNQIMFAVQLGAGLYRTLDGGTSDWEWITLPTTAYIHSISIHPSDPNKIAIARGSNFGKVIITNDGGVNWEDYTLNLPLWNNGLSIVWDDNGANGLYVGLESGIYYIDHTMSEWQEYSTNLPNAIINELEINSETRTLYAGTYGRGLWSTPMVQPQLQANCQDITVELDATGNVTILPSDIDAGSVGNTFSIDIDSFTCADIGNPVEVTLEVTDMNGNTVSCTATVTVIDTLAPTVSCPVDQTIITEEPYILPDYISAGEVTALDNCTDPVTSISQDPIPGTALGFGTHIISFTATDEYDNQSDICSFELTVEELLDNSSNTDLDRDLILYPNPARNSVELLNPSNINLENLRIFDISGRLILEKRIDNRNQSVLINVENLAPAAYILIAKSKDRSFIKYLIKK